MSYKAKYIIIDTGYVHVPIIFADYMKHSDVARAISPNGNVIGAGFVHIDNGKYVCYGESTSLKVVSRGDSDSAYLNKYLGNEGI